MRRPGPSSNPGPGRQPGISLVGWAQGLTLAAAASVPVAVNPNEMSGYQPFKAALLCLFGLALVPALLARQCRRPADDAPAAGSRARLVPGRRLLFWAAAALAGIVVVSAAGSIDPARSFWGEYETRRGAVTMLASMALGWAAATVFATPGARRRLLAAVIVPALPLSLYAILQRVGYDRQNDAVERVFSLAGNPIYLAGYLGFTILLTGWCLYDIAKQPAVATGGRRLALIIHGAFLAAQLAAFFLTESRGPTLGLAAGGAFIALTRAAMSGRRFLLWFLAIVAGCVFATAAIVRKSDGVAAHVPGASRWAEAFSTGGAADEPRLRLWEAASRILLPGSRPNLRTWLGYGPETQTSILPRYYSFPGPQSRIEGRFHDIIWDLWFESGVGAPLALLLLTGSAFLVGYGCIGIVSDRRDVALGWSAGGLGAVGAAVLAVRHFGPGLLGPAAMLGSVAGWSVFPAARCLIRGLPAGSLQPGWALYLVLLSALVMHLFDAALAFPVAATSMVFWIAIGLVGAGPPPEPPPSAAAGRRLACADGCGLGLVVGAVVFAFVSRFSFDRISPGQLLLSSLTLRERSAGASHLLEGVLLPTLLGGTVILTSAGGEAVARKRPAPGSTALGGALIAAAVAVASATIAARLAPIPGADVAPAEAAFQGRYLVWLSVGSLGVFALLGVAWAWCLSAGSAAKTAPARNPWALSLGLAAGMAACLWFGSIEPAVADARAKWAQVLMAAKRLEPALAALEGAVSADPGASPLRFMFCDCAELSDCVRPDPGALTRAAGMVPATRADGALDRSAYYRGRMLLLFAADSYGGEQRGRALESARCFGRAQELEPGYPLVYADAALVEREYSGRTRSRRGAPADDGRPDRRAVRRGLVRLL